MRIYVIYAALVIAGLVLLSLLAPLVMYGSAALVRQPSLSLLNPPVAPQSASAAQAKLNPDAARGQVLYREYCSGCHAAEAKLGPVQSNAEFQVKYSDDKGIAAVIRNGRSPMPSFPTQTMSDADLADLIAYIRTLK